MLRAGIRQLMGLMRLMRCEPDMAVIRPLSATNSLLTHPSTPVFDDHPFH